MELLFKHVGELRRVEDTVSQDYSLSRLNNEQKDISDNCAHLLHHSVKRKQQPASHELKTATDCKHGDIGTNQESMYLDKIALNDLEVTFDAQPTKKLDASDSTAEEVDEFLRSSLASWHQ